MSQYRSQNTKRDGKHDDQRESNPHLHLCLAADSVVLEAEHLIDAAVDTLDRGAEVIDFLPLIGRPGDGREDATVMLARHADYATEVAHADRREFLTLGATWAFETESSSGTAKLEGVPIFLEADKGELA